MLTTDTFEKALDLLGSGYTFPSITEETGITRYRNADRENVKRFTRSLFGVKDLVTLFLDTFVQLGQQYAC